MYDNENDYDNEYDTNPRFGIQMNANKHYVLTSEVRRQRSDTGSRFFVVGRGHGTLNQEQINHKSANRPTRNQDCFI